MITIKTIFNKRLSRFEFLDLKKSQSKRTLDVGLFTFGIVCAVFLLGLVLLLCLKRSEESSTIVRRRPITFSPDLGQFPLSIENNNFNDNIELGIVHEEGTDNNLDQCFSTGVPRNPRVPQGSSRGSAKFEKTQHFSLYSFFFNVFTRNLCHFNSAIT